MSIFRRRYVARHLRLRRPKLDVYGHVMYGPCWCSGFRWPEEDDGSPVWHSPTIDKRKAMAT